MSKLAFYVDSELKSAQKMDEFVEFRKDFSMSLQDINKAIGEERERVFADNKSKEDAYLSELKSKDELAMRYEQEVLTPIKQLKIASFALWMITILFGLGGLYVSQEVELGGLFFSIILLVLFPTAVYLQSKLIDPKIEMLTERKRSGEGKELETAGYYVTTLLNKLKDNYRKSARAAIRKIIADNSAPSYAEELAIKRWDGLSDVASQKLVVRTKAFEELESLVTTMGEGTIGVAGQRGAGKTTVLELLAPPTHKVESEEEDKKLSINVSAPIRYDARDFILYLFSSLCFAVLEKYNISRTDISQIDTTPVQEKPDWDNASLSSRILKSMTPLLLSLTGLGLVIGVYLMAAIDFKDDAQMLKALLNPAGVPYFGVALMIFGVVLKLKEDEIWLSFSNVPKATALDLCLAEKNKTISSTVRKVLHLSYKHLLNIRFQQSFSRDWKGSLSLPYISSEQSKTTNLSRNQKTLPDVIEDFTRYLRRVKKDLRLDGSVVIAIDEMDKMKSLQDAKNFLNDIKAIFSIPNCVYLVSISENALSSFERRGLPLRDVFDSSFHEVINIRYLNIEESIELLNRRVVGLPRPFQALCHCLSGGLARDLIRVARKLAGFETSSALQKIKAQLLKEEIEKRVDAVISKVSEHRDELPITDLISHLKQLKRKPVSEMSVLALEVKQMSETLGETDDNESKDIASARANIRLLGMEISTFLYFIDTLDACLPTVANNQQKSPEKVYEPDEFYDQLASIRQDLENNHSIAWNSILALRQDNKIDVWQMPASAA